MKLSCEVVRDLLPLYVEHIASEDSIQLVKEHLKECAECRIYEEQLKKESIGIEDEKVDTFPLKLIKQDIVRRKRNAFFLSGIIVGLLMFVLFFHLTKPQFLSDQESGAAVEMVGDGQLYVNFSENVTSCKYSRETWEDGEEVVILEAWTSVWDKILGKTTPSLLINKEEKDVDVIYYCSNVEEDNMKIIYGKDPNPSGGIVVLPRLVMGMYFSVGIVLTFLLGVLWFIVRRQKKAFTILKSLFFIPMSYVCAHLLLGVGFATFTAQRDFIMILICACLVYGICIFGSGLISQYKRDHELK